MLFKIYIVKVVIIQKGGDCKTQELKKCVFSELYKKCGFRNNNNFKKIISWKIVYKKNNLFINLFAKDNGRATTENKFDLPPPIDNNLYFGSMVLVACSNKNTEDNCIDLDVDIIQSYIDLIKYVIFFECLFVIHLDFLLIE